MSKGRILKMALDEIVGGVKKVDLGDLTKKVNVGDRVEAVKRMLGDAGEKVAEKADDWGWKGGKEGEITGQQFENALKVHRDNYGNVIPSYKDADRKVIQRAYTQTEKMGRGDVRSLMGDFADLEQADVPREWTGRIMKAVGRPLWEVADDVGNQLLGSTTPSGLARIVMSRHIAEAISDAMRPMTNVQRETFVALLPEWTGTLDELADAARTI